MALISDFQNKRGTAQVTFTQTGTFSSIIDMAGCELVGMYSDNWPGGAGSVTFRASASPTGTGWPVMTEAGVLARVNGFGSGTFYQFTSGSVINAAPYLILQVGTAGTAAAAGGGTIVLIGRV